MAKRCEIDELQLQVGTLKKELAAVQAELAATLVERDDARAYAEHLEASQPAIAENERIHELEQLRADLHQHVQIYGIACEGLLDQRVTLKARLHEAELQRTESQRDAAKLIEQLDEVSGKLETAKAEAAGFQATAEQYEADARVSNKRLTELGQVKTELGSVNTRLKIVRDERDRARKERGELKARVVELSAETPSLSPTTEAAYAEKVKSLESEIVVARGERDTAIAERQTREEELAESDAQVKSLVSKNAELETECSAAANRVSAAQKAQRIAEESLAELQENKPYH